MGFKYIAQTHADRMERDHGQQGLRYQEYRKGLEALEKLGELMESCLRVRKDATISCQASGDHAGYHYSAEIGPKQALQNPETREALTKEAALPIAPKIWEEQIKAASRYIWIDGKNRANCSTGHTSLGHSCSIYLYPQDTQADEGPAQVIDALAGNQLPKS